MPAAITIKRVRLESVDIVRGVITIIMALDRQFVGNPATENANDFSASHVEKETTC